jgi:uncharacterized membrane protein HdeD (DUF308 family)
MLAEIRRCNMLAQLARNWWILVLRGVAAVIFGCLAFVWPSITLAVLVLFFGAYALVDGIFAIVAALSGRGGHERWWVLLLEGLAGIAAGIMTFFWPAITEVVLLFLIAVWAIATGLVEIIAAVSLRKEMKGEWLLFLSGVASVVFGVLLFARPGAGALAVVWLIGAYALLFGVLMIGFGFRLRTWRQKGETGI